MTTDVKRQLADLLRTAAEKGRLLEDVTVAALPDYGFVGIRKQLSGVQYGFDIWAHRNSDHDQRQEIWKFECKNLAAPLALKDIAPKLIWQLGRSTIDRYIIISTSLANNNLIQLLNDHTFPMPITVVCGDDLLEMILASPSARRFLKIQRDDNSHCKLSVFNRQVFPCSVPASLDVVHQLDPPHSFDYIVSNSRVLKAYTSTELRLLATVTNNLAAQLDLHSMTVVTVAHWPNEGRVLRLTKPKGIFAPVELKFMPSRALMGESEMLNGRIWRIPPRATEVACLLMDEGTPPGIYEMEIIAKGVQAGRPICLSSCTLTVNVPSNHSDFVQLSVVGRHYDSGACHVLQLAEDQWQRIKRESRRTDQTTFLGPSRYEIMHNICDQNWLIRSQSSQSVESNMGTVTSVISASEKSMTILDLQKPVDEEIYSIRHAADRTSGLDGWQDLFNIQIGRRRNEPTT